MNLLKLYFKKLYEYTEKLTRKSILDMLETNKNAKLLDCGCWTGDFTMELSERIDTTEIYGIELQEYVAKKAREKGIRYYCHDLNKKFPLRSEFIDVVYANQVIEHLFNIDNFVKEILRVLKFGRYAIILTINLAAWHNIFSLLLGIQSLPIHISNETILGNSFDPSYKEETKIKWRHQKVFNMPLL